MKKIISVIVIAMISTSMMAQAKKWKIALHVDPNVSWIKPDNNNITAGNNKMNFGFGVAIDKMFTENYAIGTGFNVINCGGQLSYFQGRASEAGSNTVAFIERSYKLKYAEIPITLKLRTNEIGYITYWAQVGIGLGINIKSKSDDVIDYKKLDITTLTDSIQRWVDTGSDVPDVSIEDADIAEDIGIFRTSLIVAGGIEYNLSGDASIVAGVNFNNAFNNILNGNGVENSNKEPVFDKVKNTPKAFDLKGVSNIISLQIGILF